MLKRSRHIFPGHALNMPGRWRRAALNWYYTLLPIASSRYRSKIITSFIHPYDYVHIPKETFTFHRTRMKCQTWPLRLLPQSFGLRHRSFSVRRSWRPCHIARPLQLRRGLCRPSAGLSQLLLRRCALVQQVGAGRRDQ